MNSKGHHHSCFLLNPNSLYGCWSLSSAAALVMQKMINGMTVSRWACINFSRSVQESVARGFCNELAQMCQVSGMVDVLLYQFILISNSSSFPPFNWSSDKCCSAGIQSRPCHPNLQRQTWASWEGVEACLSCIDEQNQRKRIGASIGHFTWQQWFPIW